MRSKRPKKYSSFIASVGVLAIFSIIVFFLTFGLVAQSSYIKSSLSIGGQAQKSNLVNSKPAETVQSAASQKQIDSTSPLRLKIPKIKINTVLDSVGLTPQGAVGTPKGPATAAWFNFGPRPGDNGSAIITGHYGRWKSGEGSVFDNLNKLKRGDKLYVEYAKGVTVTFVVRASRTYDPNADAAEVFISNDGKSHLNLITCEGLWDKVTKSYSQRLVIFADKEDEVQK